MTPIFSASSIAEVILSWETFLGFPICETAAFTVAALIHVTLILSFFGAAPVVFIWLERKVAGRIQDRLGPTRVGGRFGWLQSIADGIKLIQKEDLCPAEADPLLFRVAPYVVFVASVGAFITLPFSNGWIAQNLDIGLFFMLAVTSLEVLGVIFAGYSSGSKWSLFGGMREAAQVVSYEIPMAICALIPILAAGTLNLVEVGRLQSGLFVNWLMFHDPATFLAFFVYLTVSLASVKRAPFDLAEAESELVGGFHTEYSGIRWSYFFMAEYASMFAVSGIATYLFLGGWNDGLGIYDALFTALGGSWIGGYIVNLFGLKVFMMKACGLVFVQIWIRWSLPRLRIDQVMMTCLKYLLPMSCALFLMAVASPLVALSLTGRPVWMGPALGEKMLRTGTAVVADATPVTPPADATTADHAEHTAAPASEKSAHGEGGHE